MQDLLENCQQLLASFDCLLLSTVDSQGEPLASFAPYIQYDDSFYILVSELAQHTQNMFSQPKASIMFIEDEKAAKNLFARERAVIQVTVHAVKEPEAEVQVLAKMQECHGNTVKLLRSLSDFHLLELRPAAARYVVGFGKAYQWDIQGKNMTHISQDVLKKEA